MTHNVCVKPVVNQHFWCKEHNLSTAVTCRTAWYSGQGALVDFVLDGFRGIGHKDGR